MPNNLLPYRPARRTSGSECTGLTLIKATSSTYESEMEVNATLTTLAMKSSPEFQQGICQEEKPETGEYSVQPTFSRAVGVAHEEDISSLPDITGDSSKDAQPPSSHHTSPNIVNTMPCLSHFSILPIELRLMIWHETINISRFIEIEWSSNTYVLTEDIREVRPYRVSRFSSQTPAVLQVNHESRSEALKWYSLYTFGLAQPVYFHPKVDILFFGQRSCIRIALDIFSRHRHPIPNVAISINSSSEGCCNLDMVHADNEGITLQTLYGTHTSSGHANGCVELKNVYFVVESALGRYVGENYPPVALRQATNDGLSLSQIDMKAGLKKAIDGAENGQGVELTGGDVWTGNEVPKFHFVSLSPQPSDGKVYDGMTLYSNLGDETPPDCPKEAIREIEQDANCIIESAPGYYISGTDVEFREFGFFGTREAVKKAKELLQAQCLVFGWTAEAINTDRVTANETNHEGIDDESESESSDD